MLRTPKHWKIRGTGSRRVSRQKLGRSIVYAYLAHTAMVAPPGVAVYVRSYVYAVDVYGGNPARSDEGKASRKCRGWESSPELPHNPWPCISSGGGFMSRRELDCSKWKERPVPYQQWIGASVLTVYM
jgi:hypothetical protein